MDYNFLLHKTRNDLKGLVLLAILSDFEIATINEPNSYHGNGRKIVDEARDAKQRSRHISNIRFLCTPSSTTIFINNDIFFPFHYVK